MKKLCTLLAILFLFGSGLFAQKKDWSFSRDFFTGIAGEGTVMEDMDGIILENFLLYFKIEVYGKEVRPKILSNTTMGENHFFFPRENAELFRIKIGEKTIPGSEIPLKKMEMKKDLLTLIFEDEKGTLSVKYELSFAEDVNYINGTIQAESRGDPIEEIMVIDLSMPAKEVENNMKGTLLKGDAFFFFVDRLLSDPKKERERIDPRVAFSKDTKKAEVKFALGVFVKFQDMRSVRFFAERENLFDEPKDADIASDTALVYHEKLYAYAGKYPFFPTNRVVKKCGGEDISAKDLPMFKRELYGSIVVGKCLGSGASLSEEEKTMFSEAVAWRNEHEALFADGHFIGGDPAKKEVYGYAAWSPSEAVIMLCNPSEEKQVFELDLVKVLELWPTEVVTWQLKSPWKADEKSPKRIVLPWKKLSVPLEAGEVLVFDALPVPDYQEEEE